MKIHKLDALMTKEFKTQEWLVDKLIPQDGFVMMSAAPSSYKTFLALELAKNVAEGKRFLGRFKTKQTGVLVIDEESGDRILQERFNRLKTDKELPIYYRSRQYDRMTDDFQEKIVSICKEKNIGLIIFDSFIRFLPAGTDENVSTSVSQVLESFNRIADNDIACLVLHHNKKRGKTDSDNGGEAMRGSGDIRAACDVHIGVTREDNIITISQTKNRYSEEIKPMRVVFENSDDKTASEFRFLNYEKSSEDWYKETKLDVYQYIADNPGLNKSQVSKGFSEYNKNIGTTKVLNIIQNLIKDGWIESQTGEHNSQKLYINSEKNPYLKDDLNQDEYPANFIQWFIDENFGKRR